MYSYPGLEDLIPIYTPSIYPDGYIVFAFPFVCSLVSRLYVKVLVKVSLLMYISSTNQQKSFIFGP